MKATLTWSLSLAAAGFVLALYSPADAERPKPRRAARSAVVRHAVAPVAQAPAVLVAPSVVSSPGVTLAVPVSSLAVPAAHDVAGGCVPVWVVEGRQTRRLPDRCPKPPASTASVSSVSAEQASVAVSSPGPGVVTRIAAGAADMPAPALAPSGAASPADAAAPRRRASKKKAPAKCARYRTWIDANGVRRSSPQCP